MSNLILVIDEGTTSTRVMLFDEQGVIHKMAQKEIKQHYPKAGWVEHDAQEIWEKTLACARQVLSEITEREQVICIGITNQRETVVAWDKKTGTPLCPAIVWQDRRTSSFCEKLVAEGHEGEIKKRTGLVLDPYFAGTKMRWMLDNIPEVADAQKRGTLRFGTIDSWLVYKLSGGQHVSDASNASRTMLCALDGLQFDDGLCDLLGVPLSSLPTIVDSAGKLGSAKAEWFGREIPITGISGDQQAAAIGQGCLLPGQTKSTYGTGAFVLSTTGNNIPLSNNGLLGTVLLQLAGHRTYALEGSIFVAGSLVQWLRDSLGLIDDSSDTEALAKSVKDNGGVTIVPALSGLGAPHWRPDAQGIINGISFSTGKAEIARAALEAMSYQTNDLAKAYASDGFQWTSLRIDGGMSANNWMAQDLADILGITVERPNSVETTALGAAMLAATGAGIYPSLTEAVNIMGNELKTFTPSMDSQVRNDRIASWDRALSQVL
jgi:glycerol kinase